jgi:hypothetical protein
LATAVALFIRYREDWIYVIGWLGQRAIGWVAGTVGLEVRAVPPPTLSRWYCSVGWLALALLGYAVARIFWSGWNRREMQLPPQPIREMRTLAYPMAMAFQVLVAGIAVSGGAQYLNWLIWIALSFAIGCAISTIQFKPAPRDSSQPKLALRPRRRMSSVWPQA